MNSNLNKNSTLKGLLVLHDFPPVAGGGVMRWLKLSKFMGRREVLFHVFTAEPFEQQLDERLVDEIDKNLVVTRIRDRYLKRLKRRLTGKRALPISEGSKGGSESKAQNRLRALYLLVRRNINVPDDHFFWAISTAVRAFRSARDADIIVTSGPPHSAHISGLLLKAFTKKRWVMDYRDSWAHNPLYKRSITACFAMDRWFENRCVNSCDAIVVDTNAKGEELQQFYAVPSQKIVVIPNGYDPEDFNGMDVKAPSDRFVLIYTGNLGGRRTVRYVVEAACRLRESSSAFREKFVLQLVGHASADDLRQLELLGEGFENKGYTSHAECTELLASASAAWLLEFPGGGGRSVAPGKTYTYIGAGTFVFATIHECHAAEVVREGPFGTVIPPDDVPAIERELLRVFEEWESNGGVLEVPRDDGRYSRMRQAEKYEDLLRSVVDS